MYIGLNVENAVMYAFCSIKQLLKNIQRENYDYPFTDICCAVFFVFFFSLSTQRLALEFVSAFEKRTANNKCSVNNKNCFQFPVDSSVHTSGGFLFSLVQSFQLNFMLLDGILNSIFASIHALWIYIVWFACVEYVVVVHRLSKMCLGFGSAKHTSFEIDNKLQFAFSSNCFIRNWLNSIYLESDVCTIIDCVIIYGTVQVIFHFEK